jgi:hypothetical protein
VAFLRDTSSDMHPTRGTRIHPKGLQFSEKVEGLEDELAHADSRIDNLESEDR